MRRVIISGGGTGGHIYPAITIARAIADIEPTEFLYVGSKIGLENTLIPKEGRWMYADWNEKFHFATS